MSAEWMFLRQALEHVWPFERFENQAKLAIRRELASGRILAIASYIEVKNGERQGEKLGRPFDPVHLDFWRGEGLGINWDGNFANLPAPRSRGDREGVFDPALEYEARGIQLRRADVLSAWPPAPAAVGKHHPTSRATRRAGQRTREGPGAAAPPNGIGMERLSSLVESLLWRKVYSIGLPSTTASSSGS